MKRFSDGGGADRDQATGLAIEAPGSSRRDEAIAITVTGAPPNDPVEFRASMEDPAGVEWRSEATFLADADGEVDLTEHEPEAGSYDGIAQMGWLWSMTPEEEDVTIAGLREADRTTVDLEATTGERSTTRTIERRKTDPGVSRRPVESDSVVGTLFEPAAPGAHPGVLVLHGSGGTPLVDTAALLAARGYAALAVRYWGDPGPIPDELAHVQLSYFEAAASWLRRQSCVRDGQLGVYGMSRGGELALLMGSRFDWVGPVISNVGSGVVYNTPDGPAAWAEGGNPVPSVDGNAGGERPAEDGTAPMLDRALEAADEETLRAATIPVEETDGPILLVSGGDDPVWPSRRLSRIAADRLEAHGFPHAFEHRTYDDAGHYITPPYLPKTHSAFGGTPAGMARADADFWLRALEYLARGLEPGDESASREGKTDG